MAQFITVADVDLMSLSRAVATTYTYSSAMVDVCDSGLDSWSPETIDMSVQQNRIVCAVAAAVCCRVLAGHESLVP